MNSDFRDLLQCLNAARVKYLLVGGYAVMHYSEPRYTKDLDIFVEPSVKNSRALYRALDAFGAPLSNIDRDTFQEPGILYICGLPPSRFDILTRIKGVDFQEAWLTRERASFAGVKTQFLSRQLLIESKKQAGRLQDKIDIKKLKAVSLAKGPAKKSGRKAARKRRS